MLLQSIHGARLTAMSALCALSLGLHGCGAGQASQTAPVAPQAEGTAPSEAATDALSPEASAPTGETVSSGQEALAGDETADTFPGTEAPAEGLEIENNGGYFVRVGDEVWFRTQSEGLLERTALWHEFLEVPASEPEDGLSEICSYDLTTGTCTERMPDTGGGYGPLYYGDDGFYSTRSAPGGFDFYWFSMDGRDARRIGDGRILGITGSGALVVMNYEQVATIALYQEGKQCASFSASGSDWLTYCGSADSSAFFIANQEATSNALLMELTTEGDTYVLGELPSRSEAPEDSFIAPECEDFFFDPTPEDPAGQGGHVYLLASWYEGTGHFLAERKLLRGVPGQDESLTEWPIDEARSTAGEEEKAKIVLTAPGEVSLAAHRAGELATTGWTGGDLVLYETPSQTTTVIRDYIPAEEPEESGAESPLFPTVQRLELVGGTAFQIIGMVRRSPEDDIGWRSAYRLDKLEYWKTPVYSYPAGELLIADGGGSADSLIATDGATPEPVGTPALP